MTLWQQFRALVNELPDRIAQALNKAALDAHRPVEVGSAAGSALAWCLRCDVEWPCDAVAELIDD